jgi:hypothetical protein
LDFDVSRPATFEGNSKSPVVRVLSVDHEPTFCAIVTILAVVRRQDARKQTIFASIDPNGELCAWIPNQMRFDAKLLSTAVLIKRKNNVCPEGLPAMICTGCLASPSEGTSVAAQVTSAAVMRCLINSLFRVRGRKCRADGPALDALSAQLMR